MLQVTDICPLSCFNDKKIFHDEFKKITNNSTAEIRIPLEIGEYFINYSPVGNYPDNPYVIICGKTTSKESHKDFVKALKNGKSLHEACLSSIYANDMRDNLFKYLLAIGLFDYLSKIVPYWETNDPKTSWNAMFDNLDDSLTSGIQLTQAFNCAIIHPVKGSAEPPEKVFRNVKDEIGCLFKHFRLNDNLKLIIFLDTPSKDRRFHQIEYWKKDKASAHKNVKIISITHPSNQNRVIFDNLNDLMQLNSNKKNNALKLFNEAKDTINCLLSELK
ncbi:hypothetical protein HWN40_06615 [Methanolobus zinderi]|uniref:Uncharacterized protein n=1 Tax=Methanolobus zinderi TaxID=536044 RepID=A0A7D5EGK0_9EURY|nr:hypothetical protein [Methanolobus zinderi]QLC49940.1 hypothetical protein HWN40_06615 [Methanolobus zinderi]